MKLHLCTLQRCAESGAVPTLTLSFSTIWWWTLTFIPWPRRHPLPLEFSAAWTPWTGSGIRSKDLPLFACSKIYLRTHVGRDCHDGWRESHKASNRREKYMNGKVEEKSSTLYRFIPKSLVFERYKTSIKREIRPATKISKYVKNTLWTILNLELEHNELGRAMYIILPRIYFNNTKWILSSYMNANVAQTISDSGQIIHTLKIIPGW